MNYRFRTNIFGKVILQIEEEYWKSHVFGGHYDTYWRDAKIEDITVDWTIALLKEK